MYQYLFNCICGTGHKYSISQLCPEPKLSFILFQSFPRAWKTLFHRCFINTVLIWQFLTQDLFLNEGKGYCQHKMGGISNPKTEQALFQLCSLTDVLDRVVQSWAEHWAVILSPRSIWSRRPTQPTRCSRENILINGDKLILTKLIPTLS